MQLSIKHITLFLSLCAALAACSDQDAWVDKNPDGKTPIELSVGGVDAPAMTRAVVTDGTNKTMQNFDTNTKIFMIMKSEYSALTSPYEELNYGGAQTTKYTVSRGDVAASSNKVTFDSNNQRYWDDAHARSSKLNIWAYAQKGMTWTQCSFGEDKAGGGYQSSNPAFDTSTRIEWRTAPIYPMIFNWKASHLSGDDVNKQNQTTVMCQDLLFSNNLVNNSSTGTNIGGTDARLSFNTSNRKFPQEGEALMKFYHAMSKITIKIIEGEGFNTSSTADFQFKSGTNVKLTGFNTEGLFSIQMGGFQQINNHAEIPSIYLKTPSPTVAPYYTLEALAVPNIDEFMQTYDTPMHDDFSRFVYGNKNLATDVMMEFTIDNNKYQITSGQLYDALHEGGAPANALVANATKKDNNGTYIPLEAGKNYIFTFIVGKQKIEHLTAQVADWEEVNADPFNPSNARIKLQLEERGTPVSSPVDIYRAEDNAATVTDSWESYEWTTGYVGNKNVFDHIDTDDDDIADTWKLTNDWFWNNNMTYYHFRAIMPSGQTVYTDATPDPDEDYVSLSSAVNYTDVLWGAPMLDVADNEVSDASTLKWHYGPETKGFDAKDDGTIAAGLSGSHQIYKAIGPTKDAVKLILFHMMSDLTIKIKTTDGSDAVTLVDGGGNKTKVQLEGFYAGGKVLLGTGLVKTDGSITPTNRTAPEIARDSEDGEYQVYKYGVVPQGLTGVQLRITTPDKNEYIVDLASIKATTVNTNNIANPYQQEGGKYSINRWYPGFKYTYSFTLAKTGITNLQATIVDWETVKADDEPVKIQ